MTKVLKEQPKPGRLTNLTVSINSLVNNPANNEDFLIKKGIDDMYLNEDEKKQLQAAGISTDEISKNETVFSKVVKFFTGKNETTPTQEPETLTVQKVSEIIKQELSEFVKKQSENKPEPDQVLNSDEDQIKKENEELKKKIQEEEELQKNQSDLLAENQRLKKSYEELLSARMPGNASTSSDNQNIQKNNDPDSWKDGFFDE